MAENNETGFKLNLDTKEFSENAIKAKKTLGEVFETESLQGWLELAGSLGPTLVGVAAATLAWKAALDLTLEGERIKQVNDSFDMLTKQAGLSSETLREGLEKAAGGLADVDDLLKAASKSVVELGSNAKQLPEVFELSRKVVKVFGGDAVERMNEISQAIATGRTRALAQMGLHIDADKALRQYAASLGVTTEALTQQDRQTALMNVVLKEGGERFKGIKTDGESVTNMVQQLKVSWKEFTDGIAQFVEKSGAVKWVLGGYRDLFSQLGQSIKNNFGSEVEQSNAQIEELTRRLTEAKTRLIAIKSQKREGGIIDFFFGPDVKYVEKEVEGLRKRLQAAIEENTKAVNEEKAKKPELKEEGESEAEKLAEKNRLERMERAREQQAKFNKEIQQMAESRVKMELDLEQNAENARLLIYEQRMAVEQQYAEREAEIRAKGAKGEELTKAQSDLMIVQLEAEKQLKLDLMREQEQEAIAKTYDNNLKHATSFYDGFEKASMKAAFNAKRDLSNYGKQGQLVFDALEKNGVSALMALGDGSKDAGDAMKGFLFGSLADIAEAQGRLHLLAGFANPAEMAAGAGLLVLAGFLRSQAKTGGASAGGGAGGGGGGGAASEIGSQKPTEETKPEGTPQEKKSVTIQVQGNYFETEQTKTRMLEMIREATDATDFKYVQIGQR